MCETKHPLVVLTTSTVQILSSHVVRELKRRQRGRVVRAPHLKSGDPDFKSRSYHQLDFFQVVRGSTPLLRLRKANWSTSR